MHSLGYRVNALSAFAVTALALICVITSFTDNFNSPSPAAELHALTINRFRKKLTGDDEVSLSLNVSTNLESIFTWNTKQVFVFLAAEYGTPKNALNQVSLWDSIIPSKELAKFQIHTSNKYRFIDQGSNLRGKDFNLTMHWHVMPKTGKMFADNLVIGGFRLPESYNKQKAVVSEDINSTNREVAVNVVPGANLQIFLPANQGYQMLGAPPGGSRVFG